MSSGSLVDPEASMDAASHHEASDPAAATHETSDLEEVAPDNGEDVELLDMQCACNTPSSDLQV